ncbi:RNAse G [Keratinibaculum paraultunense]|uniref:RNAse G n=1 Tax=Keratinibaculum paraultunense TaxID=1278232 RepID=A0A4R3KYP4_9FIRM|nr:Rne/Rng family ribonuclease [Keratinibaculum paraultunense]QQY80430.1 Rne/Rng family ribonuclease [Keratinibaculum paraultunense]TCS91146.1 RNAse G [Keratinibaculum paraultunense]
MNYIFIDSKGLEEKVGIIEEGRLVEYYIDKKKNEKCVGNIYRGRVINVLPGMEAAFVDIGEKKNAYLYVKDALPKDMIYKNSYVKIEKVIKKGQEVIVQVLKESSKNKGPKVTTHITLPGRYLVLTPYSSKINISRKIHDEEEIKRLLKIGMEIKKDDIGFIFRTQAEGIEKDKLFDEYTKLINLYSKLERERNFLPCPKLLYRDVDLGYKIVRDAFNDKIHKIIVNDKEKYDRLLDLQDMISSELKDKLFFQEDFTVEKQEYIMKNINLALERKVPLKSGGYIVIDETEALTAIDVNTGKYIGSKSLEDTIVKTNLEAAEEIARQIRLRDIGGIIIIDFIDMKNNQDVNAVVAELEKYLSFDRNKTNIVGMTKLGLVEMTRHKVRNSLGYNFIKICPYCYGKGKILESAIDKRSSIC